MRTTVTIDDALMKEASAAAGTTKPSEVMRQALEALIEREAARRLILLGGSDRNAQAPPRRRSRPAGRDLAERA